MGNQGVLERFFKLSEHKTNARTEVIAGITTFMTMAYILIVNPLILLYSSRVRETNEDKSINPFV